VTSRFEGDRKSGFVYSAGMDGGTSRNNWFSEDADAKMWNMFVITLLESSPADPGGYPTHQIDAIVASLSLFSHPH